MNKVKCTRPVLNKVDLSSSFKETNSGTTSFFITMLSDQWDKTLATFYDRGATLVEVDAKGRLVSAYRKEGSK